MQFVKFPSAQKLSVVSIVSVLKMPLLSRFLLCAHGTAGLPPSLPLLSVISHERFQ